MTHLMSMTFFMLLQLNLELILLNYNVLANPDNPEDNPDYHNPDAVADNSDLADDPEQVNTDSN